MLSIEVELVDRPSWFYVPCCRCEDWLMDEGPRAMGGVGERN
jgi:hypothetical protein